MPAPPPGSTTPPPRPRQPRIEEGQWLLIMARKPPNWRQPSLFPPDPATSAGQAPATPAEPHSNATLNTDGEHYAAVQKHDSGTPATTAGDSPPASQGAEATPDDGALREGAENQPPG